MSPSRLWLDRRAKPSLGLARINWAHPLSRGLIACYPFNEGAGRAVNLARVRYDLSPVGTAAFGTSPVGRTGNCDLAADIGFAGPVSLPAALRPVAASVVAIGYFTGVPDNNSTIAGWTHNNTDTNPWMSLAIASTGGGVAVFYNGAGNFESMVGGTVPTNRRVMYGGSYAAVTGQGRLYEDGRLTSTGSAIGDIQYGGTAHFAAGIALGTSGRNSHFRALLVLAWNYQLPHALMRAVHLDPWQLFEPVQARRFSIAPSGTIYDETIALAARGAFASSGPLASGGTVSLAARGTMSHGSAAAIATAITLAVRGAVSDSGAQQMQDSASMATQAAMAASQLATLIGTTSIGAAAALSPSAVASLLGAIQLGSGAGLTPSSLLVLDLAQAFTAAAAIVTDGDLGPAIHTETVSLAARALLQTSGQAALAQLTALSVGATMTPAAQQTLAGLLAMEIRADISATGQQVVNGALLLGASAAQAEAAAISVQASLTLGIAALLSAAGSISTAPVLEALTLASERLVAGVTFSDERFIAGIQFSDERLRPE